MTSSTEGIDVLRFARPTRQIILMMVILAGVLVGAVLVWPRVQPVFLAAPFLNGLIGIVFVVGVAATFFQVIQLFSSVQWLETFVETEASATDDPPPRLLAAMVGVRRLRGSRVMVTSASAKSVLDSVGARMEESRDVTRYIANLLIFLGLLGTFFGLATTVPAVVETIRSLQPTEGEQGLAVFGRLMDGLNDQLGGMGTAFASSLLGLAGSLVVGLLELYAGHGQNRFYRELEEWLASITRVSFSGDGDGVLDKAAIATVLDHMVDQVDALQSLFSQYESKRAASDDRLDRLSEAVGELTERLGPGHVTAMEGVSAGQARLAEAVEALSIEPGLDAESRYHLRSMDDRLHQLSVVMEARSEEAELLALRGDLTRLTNALNALTRAATAPAPPPRREPDR